MGHTKGGGIGNRAGPLDELELIAEMSSASSSAAASVHGGPTEARQGAASDSAR